MSRSTAVRPYNVVLIHCHDLGRFLGTYGIESVRSPHLDGLASESVVFDQAYAAAPQCSPARAALVTGKYPQRNGVLGLTHAPFNWDLTNPKDHIAHHLSSQGYGTALVGVQHESKVLADDVVARRLGFDRVQTGGMADVVADRGIAALDELAASANPFYLQVGFYEPHRIPGERDQPGVMGFLGDHIEPDSSLGVTVPRYLHDDEEAREEVAELQGAVSFMDSQVGRVLDAIDRRGLRDTTLVIFTTDHGLALPRAKCSLYDPGLEVALFVRAPFRPGWSGVRVDGLVSHVDVRPTILELLQLPAETGRDGVSLVSVVETGAPASEHIYGQLTYHNYYDPKRSVRSERHKLIVNFTSAPLPMDPTQSWVRRTMPGDIWHDGMRTTSPMELYDLASDPVEMHNLADDPAHAPTIASLGGALMKWMREVDDPLLAAAVTSPHHAESLAVLEEVASSMKADVYGAA
jgi:N-sulfoglucosamine sulfohydrolase